MYLIGDVQGCDSALERLTQTIDFSPSRDTLFFLGDLVNRGPDSAAVLRRLIGYAGSARCVLGNHDLHLLALSYGVRKPGRKDTLTELLRGGDAQDLLRWLHQQPLAALETVGQRRLLLVHAGVLPSWTASQTVALAGEVQAALTSGDARSFFTQMYGNGPHRWSDSLEGADRMRVIVNALTRMRFLSTEGDLEFEHSGGLHKAPEGHLPWFDAPQRQTASDIVAFGHWSSLGWLNRPDVLSLDTGCVWGGCLSALRVSATQGGHGLSTELIQVKCEASQPIGE